MKNLFAIVLLFAAMLCSCDAMARFSEPVQSPQHAAFIASGASMPTILKVHDAIVQAGAARGWQVTAEQTDKLTLRNVIRNKHVVVVDLAYDTKGVDVVYVSSENLNYETRNGVAYIHPKYNEWVKKLLQDIVRKVDS